MSQLDILSAICNLKYLCNTVQIFDDNGYYVNCSNKILELENTEYSLSTGKHLDWIHLLKAFFAKDLNLYQALLNC